MKLKIDFNLTYLVKRLHSIIISGFLDFENVEIYFPSVFTLFRNNVLSTVETETEKVYMKFRIRKMSFL